MELSRKTAPPNENKKSSRVGTPLPLSFLSLSVSTLPLLSHMAAPSHLQRYNSNTSSAPPFFTDINAAGLATQMKQMDKSREVEGSREIRGITTAGLFCVLGFQVSGIFSAFYLGKWYSECPHSTLVGPGSNPLELAVILSSLLGFRNKVLARKNSGAGGLSLRNRRLARTGRSRRSKRDNCPKPVRELPEQRRFLFRRRQGKCSNVGVALQNKTQ